jgi:hypothetical protein
MNKKQIIVEINNILEKYQFRRNGETWNREFGDFVDVIDVQVGKSNDIFTINIGVGEKYILDVCWDISPTDFVGESSCTVRTRLGVLLFQRDKWWGLSEAENIDGIIAGLQNEGMKFLQENHSLGGLIATLEESNTAKFPPEAIYHALLYYRVGEVERSLKMFLNLERKLSGAWREKVLNIRSSVEFRS